MLLLIDFRLSVNMEWTTPRCILYIVYARRSKMSSLSSNRSSLHCIDLRSVQPSFFIFSLSTTLRITTVISSLCYICPIFFSPKSQCLLSILICRFVPDLKKAFFFSQPSRTHPPSFINLVAFSPDFPVILIPLFPHLTKQDQISAESGGAGAPNPRRV